MESLENPTPKVIFEDRPPIASEEEALRMLAAGKYSEDEPNVEGHLVINSSEEGPYILQTKIVSWPERIEWQKKYRLLQTVADSLIEKGYVGPLSPGVLSISRKGIGMLS